MSILMLLFLMGVMVGIFAGLYLGNKGFRQAINSLFHNKDEDEEYDEDEEDYDR